MLIVGSRGLGNLKGHVLLLHHLVSSTFQLTHDLCPYSILLGSTSHYLIQKCSVPVMVARRRLKRPPRRAAHLKAHRARVSLAEAAVASDPSIAREFEKMSGKTSVAAAIIKAGVLVKVIGFDASYDALATHNHSDEWQPVLEKAFKGELAF